MAKECQYCGCRFKTGKGVKKNGKKIGFVPRLLDFCTFGMLHWILMSGEKYCSRECYKNDQD